MAFALHRFPRQHGFSLMEITIGMVLLGILSVVGSTMIASSFFTTRIISTEHLAYSSARYAMERMGRELREIQYDTVSGTVSISTMTATQLAFTKSGLTQAVNVGFQYAAPALTMSTPAGVATLASDIGSFSFSYLDVNKAATTVPNDVRFIRIAMTMAPAQAEALPLVTQINLRNL